jgi:lipid-A-disaccharide synthase
MSKRIFISAGEPSGDVHGSNLAKALKSQWPDVELIGFGGPKMAEAGVNLNYKLTDHAVMGFGKVVGKIGTFLGIIKQAATIFDEQRPDAVVLIDYPGLHWWIAKRAKQRGIPVFYHVPPQLWAWAGWRVKKVKDRFSYLFCSLPFEPKWYADRGYPYAEYVGHPFFDDLAERKVDETWVEQQKSRSDHWLAILPGSRQQEIESNLPMMIKAIERVSKERPDVRYAVACLSDAHKAKVEKVMHDHPLPAWFMDRIELFVARTPEILRLAEMAWSVSGSVSLELMYETVPTVIVYRVKPIQMRMSDVLLKAPFITLTNLLAGWDVMPEYPTEVDVDKEMADWALLWLNDPTEAKRKREALATLRDQYCQPGASATVAARIAQILEAWSKLK